MPSGVDSRYRNLERDWVPGSRVLELEHLRRSEAHAEAAHYPAATWYKEDRTWSLAMVCAMAAKKPGKDGHCDRSETEADGTGDEEPLRLVEGIAFARSRAHFADCFANVHGAD